MPRVSFLLPIRNVAQDIAECVQSMKDQTFADFEVLAINDGSTDQTAENYLQAAGGDERFQLLQATGSGIVDALNQANEQSSGPLLARMDGDDLCHPRRLELQLDWLDAHPQAALVGSLVRIFPRPLTRGMARYESWLNARIQPQDILHHLFVESPLAHPTILMRRQSFEKVGGYRDPGWPEDYDLWLRFAAAGELMGKVPEVLLEWRDRPQRTSRTQPQYSPDAFRRCKLHHLKRAYPLEKGCIIIGAGPTGKPWSHLLRQEGLPLLGFVEVHPRKVGTTIHGVPVVTYEQMQALGPAVVLVAVGREGARQQVREFLHQHPPATSQEIVFVA